MVIVNGLKTSAQTGTIDATERAFLIDYLSISLNETKETLKEVDKDLWQYKSKNERWSIGECMEHIMIAEKALMQQVKGTLQQQANNNKSLSHRDGYVIAKTVDRGKKVKTPLEPQNVSMTKNQYLKELEKSRDEIIEFLADENLALRNHFGKSPFGEVDTYQLILIIAAHGMRHTAQMKEIIAEYTNTEASY